MSDNTTDLLQKLQSGEITLADCQSQLNATEQTAKQIHYKVSPKGCISFYNLRRMPISLYINELEQILDVILSTSVADGHNYNDTFAKFLQDNKDKLSAKTKK
jgi:hypothetical protein